MRLIVAVLVMASSAFAQGRLNPIGNSGNVLHPGIPAAGAPGTGRMGFAPGPLSGGFQRGGGGQRGDRFRGGGRTVVVPYPIYGGYGLGYMGTGFYQPEPGTYDPIWGIYNPGPGDYGGQSQQPQAPTVVINQNFQPDTIHPVLRDYSNVQLPEPTFKQVVGPPDASAAGNDQATIYLIATKDHTIHPVLGYWLDKGALSFVTVDSVIGHVPLDQVDREFSQRLNDERHVEFQLPSGK
jgi:hypothetical protein